MEKLIFKTITAIDELNFVLNKIEHYSGVRLPFEYIKRSKTVGAFLHNQLVASYIIVTKPNFRSLLFVPDSVKQTHTFFSNDQYEMMEVNGLWIGPAVKTPKMQFLVWLQLAKDIILSRKKYLLLMSSSKNKNIGHLHSLTNPKILYNGAPNLMAGDNSHSSIQVSYTTRWSIILNIPKYLLELRRRQIRAEQFAKERTYVRELKISEAEFV